MTLVQLKILDRTLNNISDDKLIVEHDTYIREYGLRPGNQQSLRKILRHYHTPNERQINIKVLDMMKQQVYATQDKMRRLTPILAKYKNKPAFRMAFIMNRLNQLIIDMRRIYTQALRWRENRKRVFNHIVWYTYMIRKYMDILYIVEHTIEYHTENMKNLKI